MFGDGVMPNAVADSAEGDPTVPGDRPNLGAGQP
jgi:hypothetical protein